MWKRDQTVDNKTLAQFDKMLRRLRDQLLEEKEDIRELAGERLPDSLDAADVNARQEVKTKLLKRKTQYLRKIDEALKRIFDGTYGECAECGDDISEKRLKARLTATLCISCKEDQEREEKVRRQNGGSIFGWDLEPED